MNFEAQADTFLINFKNGINQINSQKRDDFHNQLYFSNVISLMEQFLSNLFVFEITNSRESLQKLANHEKFKATTVTVAFALNNSIETYLIHAMKALVWHRLNDVEMFYKKVLGFSFNISGELLKQLELRHDLVHRNGFNLNGDKVEISDDKLEKCISLVDEFICDIHKKYTRAHQ